MDLNIIKDLFKKHREINLSHRYITNHHIEPLFINLKKHLSIEVIGQSVLGKSIYGIQIGTGTKRILMWSQMHGNETTTTKAIFDLLNCLVDNPGASKSILEECSLYIIPILNPDGAAVFTRVNANLVDLNRDAQDLTQPESKVLRTVFNRFKPHYCYNLHGQRTIFSVGKTDKPATVSFLAPAQDAECTVTSNRKVAMEIIAVMNESLQKLIPGQVGVYDDAFNINCVGDTFQSEHIPTILFEAGHFKGDYAREQTREYIFISYLVSLNYIALNRISGENFGSYLAIPENDKLFLDIIIRDVDSSMYGSGMERIDIGFLFQERLVDGVIQFIPKVERIANLEGLYAHQTIEAHGVSVLAEDGSRLQVDYENVCVMLKNEKMLLFPK